MGYQPKLIRGKVKCTGYPIDGRELILSLWDYDNYKSYHLSGWCDDDDEAVMQTIYRSENEAGFCVYATLEDFARVWEAGEYEPEGVFCLAPDNTEVLEVIRKEQRSINEEEVSTTLKAEQVTHVIESVPADNCKCLTSWDYQNKRVFDENGSYPCMSSGEQSGADFTAVLHSEILDMTHANDVIRECGEVSPTLQARMGTGGNQIPLVFEPTYCIQGNTIDRSDTAGANGKGVIKGKSYTLNTVDRPAVAYAVGIQPNNSTSAGGLSDIEEKSPTLSCTKKTGVIACYPINTQIVTRSNKLGEGTGMGIGDDGDPAYTLQAAHSHGIIFAIDRAAFNQGANAQYDFQIDDSGINSTIIAKGPSAVCHNIPKGKLYVWIVRRLTPLECCRLQGYPDWWAQNLDTAEPTEEDLAFWADVFETHRKAIDPSKKPKTKNQIKKWLQDPQTDSAEYKMWGNSLAIPCAYTVLAGIAEELREQL